MAVSQSSLLHWFLLFGEILSASPHRGYRVRGSVTFLHPATKMQWFWSTSHFHDVSVQPSTEVKLACALLPGCRKGNWGTEMQHMEKQALPRRRSSFARLLGPELTAELFNSGILSSTSTYRDIN